MGTLIVQIGQCGNQVGVKLWDQLKTHHTEQTDFLFREGDSVSHSILIDTEPKVLKDIKKDRLTYAHYDPRNVIYYQHGRGNNWAMGYFNSKNYKKMQHHHDQMIKFDKLSILEKANLITKNFTVTSPKKQVEKESTGDEIIMRENSVLLEQASSLIQKEIEKIDYYTGTMFISSLAGGTGSGFGSRLIEELRDDYTVNMLYNTAIFPSANGENPLQQYNSILSLSHMQNFSDGILYFQNEKIFKYINRVGGINEEKTVNLDDMNDYIASMLVHMLKLNDIKSTKNFYFDYLNELTAMNECKFVELLATPFTLRGKYSAGIESTWDATIDNFFLQTSSEIEQNEYIRSKIKDGMSVPTGTIGLKCIMKSVDVDVSFLKSEVLKKTLDKKLHRAFNPLKWNPDAIHYEYIKDKIKTQEPKSMMVIANRVDIVNTLEHISEIAKSKFKAKAYLHWYVKYGLEEEDFRLAFENVNTIIDNYSYMLSS